MSGPATDPRLASDACDAVLALALGGLAATQRFEEIVSKPSDSASMLQPDDLEVLAALGLISMGRSLRRWIEQAAAEQAGSPSAPVSPPDDPLQLRDLLR